MTISQIRPVARCVFRKDDTILVKPASDSETKEACFQLIGGNMRFGEYSWEAVRREVRSELGEEIKNLTFLGPSEQVFPNGTEREHEIVFMFEGEFVNGATYQKNEIKGKMADGKEFVAVWKPLREFRRKKAKLYPEGLLDMLPLL